jgi:hypothetical protein
LKAQARVGVGVVRRVRNGSRMGLVFQSRNWVEEVIEREPDKGLAQPAPLCELQNPLGREEERMSPHNCWQCPDWDRRK